MKKIFVVLLVLAVAGGVFAQEVDWWIGGKANIGVGVDFDVDTATSTGTGYNSFYKGWGPQDADVSIGANKGGFSGNFTLSAHDAWALFSEASYNGENYGFTYNQGLLGLGGGGQEKLGIRRLWGYYNLLNGLVYLEGAYDSKDNGDSQWVSEKTASVYFARGGNYPANDPLWDDGDTFTKYDHPSIFLTDVRMSGLSFGLLFKNLFEENGSAQYGGATTEFVEDVLKKIILGVKFQMSPFEFAAQMKMENYGIYFGGKVNLGPITAGLSFMGEFPSDDSTAMSFGASVNYGNDLFGAGLKAWYGLMDNATVNSQIGVEPSFYYNVIPTHLQFKANVGFYFNYGDAADAINSEAGNAYVQWALQPQLFWNFLGTGAKGGYWDLGTGMIVRYRMVRDVANALDITFKWSM